MPLRRLALAAVLVALAAPARPAAGQTPRDQARAYATSAEVLVEAGKWDAAALLFQKAYFLDPAPILLYNVARMHDRMGDHRRAREVYERYLGEEKDPAGLERGRARLTELLSRMPGRLEVVCLTAGARVVIDGKEAGAVPLKDPIELAPGLHVLEVTAIGKLPFRRDVEIGAGGAVTKVPIVLEPIPKASPPPEPEPARARVL